MKLLIVLEYKMDLATEVPKFSFTVIDSRKIGYSGNLVIRDLEISVYSDIFYIDSLEDVRKFKVSGFDLNDFEPIADMKNGYIFTDAVIEKILDWADASRAWVYVNPRVTGTDRLKFDEFFKKLEWQKGE